VWKEGKGEKERSTEATGKGRTWDERGGRDLINKSSNSQYGQRPSRTGGEIEEKKKRVRSRG